MTNDEVKKVIQDFIKCAYHARPAGYDGIETQAAHGYLLRNGYALHNRKNNLE